MAPVLVYLYGPPAVGKLTIAERVRELTGFRLFHNHLTVNAVREVFDFGTPPFVELLHRLRLDVFATAMREEVSLIFTNNSAWGGPDARDRFAAFADHVATVVETNGGRVVFVRLTAPQSVLESRVGDESRRVHGKLLEISGLRALLADLDQSALHDGDLSIDTAQTTVDQAACRIATLVTGPSRGDDLAT